MDNAHRKAQQIVCDVMVLMRTAPPAGGQPFRMWGIEATQLPADRLTLAKSFAHLVPQNATPADAPRLVSQIARLLRT